MAEPNGPPVIQVNEPSDASPLVRMLLLHIAGRIANNHPNLAALVTQDHHVRFTDRLLARWEQTGCLTHVDAGEGMWPSGSYGVVHGVQLDEAHSADVGGGINRYVMAFAEGLGAAVLKCRRPAGGASEHGFQVQGIARSDCPHALATYIAAQVAYDIADDRIEFERLAASATTGANAMVERFRKVANPIHGFEVGPQL